MAASSQRRGHGDDSIYFDASKNRWIGATSLGHSPDGRRRIRYKVRGRTKAEIREKLKALRQELDAGLQPSASYTVQACVEDWLATGLTALQAETIENYTRMAEHVIAELGGIRLKSLSARHVQSALAHLAPTLSTRSLRLVHQVLERSIRHAQAADLVARNVASLVTAPKGRTGRPSKSLNLLQAIAVLDASEDTPLAAYVSLSLLSGLRTEELRSLLWTDTDLGAGTLAVFRSVRATGDTKTPKSRRVLKLPAKAVAALQNHRLGQSEARL